MTIHILSICLLSSTTIYSANNESKKPESNVPQLQYLIMKNFVENRVPLEVVAPALNNNLHLKDPYTQESAQLGEWPDVKQINEQYKKLGEDICTGKKPLNSKNARIILYPSGPWDNEQNKKYKRCLDCYTRFLSSNPHVDGADDHFTIFDNVSACSTSLIGCVAHGLLLDEQHSPTSWNYLLCICNIVSCLPFICNKYQHDILKKIVNPKTWQSSTAPQNLTMSEGVDVNESSNFAASSNMLNTALKMKED